MNALVISPLQWSDLQDIDDVEPINIGDTECLLEIRNVLKKHGKMDRLGVALLHSHFDMSNDEIMLESSNDETRTLVIQPVKQQEAGTNNVGTIFMLREGDPTTMTWCKRYCKRQFFGHGDGHREVS